MASVGTWPIDRARSTLRSDWIASRAGAHSLLAACPGKLHRFMPPVAGGVPRIATRCMRDPRRNDRPFKRQKHARTASGKKANPQLLAEASLTAQEGLRERTEAGHLAAGRTPPSQRTQARSVGAARVVDDAIRSYAGAITEDEKLLQAGSDPDDFTRTDPWRVMRIMGEFIEGFDTLAAVTKGVTIFGSARTHPDDPRYQSAQEVARLLARAGFAIITGAGPGIM